MDEKFDQKLTESHLPGQSLDIALVPGNIYVSWEIYTYIDIAQVAGQYMIHCPAKAFDSPMQSVRLEIYISPKCNIIEYKIKLMHT